MQEPVCPHPSQPLGQDVLQNPPEEPARRFGQGLPAPGLTVLVAEGDLLTVVIHDVLLPEYAAIEVTGQIGQRLVATADLLALGDPVSRNRFRQGKALLAHPGKEFGAKHGGQGPAVEQVSPGPGVPVMARQPAPGDHDVDMGVESQAPGVGCLLYTSDAADDLLCVDL